MMNATRVTRAASSVGFLAFRRWSTSSTCLNVWPASRSHIHTFSLDKRLPTKWPLDHPSTSAASYSTSGRPRPSSFVSRPSQMGGHFYPTQQRPALVSSVWSPASISSRRSFHISAICMTNPVTLFLVPLLKSSASLTVIKTGDDYLTSCMYGASS
jgi:hypothetical protein